MSETEQTRPPKEATWRSWLLAAGLVGAPLAFGVYATMNQAAFNLLSGLSKAFFYVYVPVVLVYGLASLMSGSPKE